MKRYMTFLLASCLVTAGCGSRKEAPEPAASGAPHADEHADEGGEQHEDGDAHGDEAPVVKIDPEMLRDLRVTTAVVESRPAAEGAPVLGELHVDETRYAEVGAPVPARAVRVPVTAGQAVRRGQLLAELQSLDVGKGRGDLKEAQARLELARQVLARKRALAEERIAPRREVQEAEAEVRSAEAAVQSATSGLQAMGADAGAGSTFSLTSPVSGTVIERNLVAGQVTDPAKPLFRVGDLSRLWLVAHAPEREAVRVQAGSVARVTIPALPGEVLSGRILSVGSQVEVSSRTIPVRIELPNPSGVLRPGMAASVWLAVGDTSKSVIAVPAASLQRVDDKWCVFVPEHEGEFQVRTVGRGRDLGGEVEIVSGLKARETVVVEGAFLLKAEMEKARGAGGHHDH
jgi:cobalt-zinc-cadmium efflux system membrane fusion protein